MSEIGVSMRMCVCEHVYECVVLFVYVCIHVQFIYVSMSLYTYLWNYLSVQMCGTC